MSRHRGRPLGYTRPPAGTGTGLDWVGGAPVAGQVRSERVAWAAGEKEMGVGVLAGLQVPEVFLLVHRPRIRAQPSCRICRLLSLPRTNRPQVWGAHILPPTAQDTACGPHLPAPRQHLHSSLKHRCLFTQMGEQGAGGRGGALLRETSLSETLPPRDHFPQRRGRSKVQPGSAGWGR